MQAEIIQTNLKTIKMKTRNYLLLIGLAITILSSCEKDKNCIYGSGSMVSRDYSISNFDELYMYGEAEVFITRAGETSLRIEGQANVLNALNVEVNNGNLSIGRDNCFKESSELKVYLSTPELSGVSISGLCDVQSYTTFSADHFNAEIDGTGSMDLNLDVEEFSVNISGDGEIMASGKADMQSIRISGKGDLELFELIGTTGDIDIDGMGEVEINVSESLDVTISGSGDIYYLGNPSISQNISGLGNIINANE